LRYIYYSLDILIYGCVLWYSMTKGETYERFMCLFAQGYKQEALTLLNNYFVSVYLISNL